MVATGSLGALRRHAGEFDQATESLVPSWTGGRTEFGNASLGTAGASGLLDHGSDGWVFLLRWRGRE